MAGTKDEEPFAEPLEQVLNVKTWTEVASQPEPSPEELARRQAEFEAWEARSRANPPKRVTEF